jgi:hypothetical protein
MYGGAESAILPNRPKEPTKKLAFTFARFATLFVQGLMRRTLAQRDGTRVIFK